MGKLQFCTPLLGRRGFLRNCVLLSAGAAVFGVCVNANANAARKPEPKGGFVIINGWVLPVGYFQDGRS
ncbi:hypothetical protein BGP84_11940 [Pseudomonas putida]|uniref:Uncharacterized protein n=1 Tax=Pseudomonas putida TaxID=303 RepID=A0A2S3X7F7_PSEPU|nr:hypothetical protein [Pseudomonas sp.]POG11531.1 hypothetical protein BGP84_11940 [Pseudomonas putida]POG16873.1 hypothetical protein BGP85_10430 [Pseudomonas putida]QHG68214.1 hypothetical protein C2H86_10705 [Pseudomonas putida]